MNERPAPNPVDSGGSPFDELPLPVLELAPDGHASHVNAAFVELTALPAEESRGMGWWAAVPVESRAALAQAISRGQAATLLLRLRRCDGVTARTEVQLAPRWGGEGLLAVIHDVTASHQREADALAETERFRLMADNVPVAIAYYESAGNTCRYANRRYAQTFGLDERSIIGLTSEAVIGAAAEREIRPTVDRALQQRFTARYERQLAAPDGSPRWIDVHLVPHLDPRGQAIGAFVLIADVTRYRQAEAKIRESEERLAKFMQASAEGIVFHKDGLITDVNPPLLQLLGYTLDEMRGRSTLDFIAPEQRARVLEVIRSGREITYDSIAMHKDGHAIPVEFIVRTMVYQGERLRMTIVRDIRDRLAAQSRIHYLAHHDALTGLPNRHDFLERVEQSIARAAAEGRTLALLFVDIDHFKRVNDSLGHLAGDALLQVLARRITDTLRATDLVARFAGDEFVVLLDGQQDHDAIQAVAHKLLAAIEAPTDLDGPLISVTPSIGVALFPRDASTSAELLQHADTAMYHAKSRGRAQCLFFEPEMAREAYRRLVLESELGEALKAGQFALHFQPQLRLSDGELVGYEALLRWHHPQRGLLRPDEFLPVAEERRIMLGIGRWVLDEALRHAVRWRSLGLAAVPVGLNLSTVQFHSAGFVDIVAGALAAAGADGSCLEIELTERLLMEDLPAVRGTLDYLRARGIRIAIDDFGTGYTSLGHLKDLPVDRLKIDRSFIEDIPRDEGAAAVAQAIVRLGTSLRLGVVAEGVETHEQLRWLATHGCDEAQGHLIAPPMDAESFGSWLQARRALPQRAA
jgi:diguanylate cyclase (GGDEF)-like protein/PAS domain S-box-containing protein